MSLDLLTVFATITPANSSSCGVVLVSTGMC